MVKLEDYRSTVVLPILPEQILPPRPALETIEHPPAPPPPALTPAGPAPDRAELIARFRQVLWERLRGPLFLWLLGMVFLVLLVASLRSRKPTRWRTVTARSFLLSAIIHVFFLVSFESVVLTQRVLQTLRDPEFEVLLDSESLIEEKVSLGIREETTDLPLADATAAQAVAPQPADIELPRAAPVQEEKEIAPGHVETEAFVLPPDLAPPRPAERHDLPTPLAARPAADFRIALPPIQLEAVRSPVKPPPETESSPTLSPQPQKIERPLAALPPVPAPSAGGPAQAPPLGPGAPLTESLVALPAPPGVPEGRPIEPAVPPRVLRPHPAPRIVPPPFVLEEQPVSEETYLLREPARREKVLERLGGTTETEKAVQDALAWLAAHQSEDGRWDIEGFDARCKQCGGEGGYGKQDVAATGLALLAFLGANHTHKSPGPYRQNVAAGIAWLLAQMRKGGDLRGEGNMYDQGMATIALAEACGMTQDPALRPAVADAVRFIAAAQHPQTGGWRYFPHAMTPDEPGDTSVFGWQVMALKSAQMAGLPVPGETLNRAALWFERVGGGQHGGLCGYQGKSPTPSMTAEAMFARQLMGAKPTDPAMIEAADYLRKSLPRDSDPNMYYWYYGTLALFQHQGPVWEEWNRALRRVLLSSQETQGARKGSWPPRGQWGTQGGRVVETAMAALCLEVYYRYLPMYAPPAAAGGNAENKQKAEKATKTR